MLWQPSGSHTGSLPSCNCLQATSVTFWSVVIGTAVINSLCLSPVSHDYSCLRSVCRMSSANSLKQSNMLHKQADRDWQGRGGHQCRRPPNSVLYISNFSAVLSTFRDWFPRIRMKPRDWQVGLPHSHPIAQLTHSPTKLCPSSSVSDCICASWTATYSPSAMYCVVRFRQVTLL